MALPLPCVTLTLSLAMTSAAVADTLALSAGMTSAAVAEAARKRWGSSGARRIPIELIGAYPENRGKLGVSAWHVHEVHCVLLI